MIEFSPYVLTVFVSIITAQALKYILLLLKGRKFDPLRQLYASGNMPSVHSTSVIALLTLVYLRDGMASGLFGVTLLFAIIVMYDTVMVRRSVGDQGRAIQQLIKEKASSVAFPHSAKGHTPLELLAGAALGAVMGLVVFSATQ